MTEVGRFNEPLVPVQTVVMQLVSARPFVLPKQSTFAAARVRPVLPRYASPAPRFGLGRSRYRARYDQAGMERKTTGFSTRNISCTRSRCAIQAAW